MSIRERSRYLTKAWTSLEHGIDMCPRRQRCAVMREGQVLSLLFTLNSAMTNCDFPPDYICVCVCVDVYVSTISFKSESRCQ